MKEASDKPVAFLDTSILLGYLLDEEERAEACLALLQKAERGVLRLRTTPLVIAEIVWTLQSKRYGLTPQEIRDRLMPVLTLRGLILDDKQMYSKVMELYCAHNIDFTDAFNASVMLKDELTSIYSYDHHYDRLSFLKRMEP
jgi:predicted nucleic acid-binding protein